MALDLRAGIEGHETGSALGPRRSRRYQVFQGFVARALDRCKPSLACALREQMEVVSREEPPLPLPHLDRQLVAVVPDEIYCPCLLLQRTGVPVFESEVENAGSLFRMPVRLFLRIGTPGILLKKSQHPRCAVYTRLSSPAEGRGLQAKPWIKCCHGVLTDRELECAIVPLKDFDFESSNQAINEGPVIASICFRRVQRHDRLGASTCAKTKVSGVGAFSVNN